MVLQQIRLRRRHGRFHRALLFSSNRNKAKLLEPTYREKFRIRPAFTQELEPDPHKSSLAYVQRPVNFPSERYLQSIERFPLGATYDLREVLARVKSKYDGSWDELQGKEWVDLLQEETEIEVREADTTSDVMAEATAEATAEAMKGATANVMANAGYVTVVGY